MPHPTEPIEPFDPITSDFVVISRHSHHKGIEHGRPLLVFDLDHLLADPMCPSYPWHNHSSQSARGASPKMKRNR